MSFIWQPTRLALRRPSPLPTLLQTRPKSTFDSNTSLHEFLSSSSTNKYAKEISTTPEDEVSPLAAEDFVTKTIPYPTRNIPQKSDPLSDLFVNLTMKDGKRLRAILGFHKILQSMYVFILSLSLFFACKERRGKAKKQTVPNDYIFFFLDQSRPDQVAPSPDSQSCRVPRVALPQTKVDQERSQADPCSCADDGASANPMGNQVDPRSG